MKSINSYISANNPITLHHIQALNSSQSTYVGHSKTDMALTLRD